jgi:hypothetical protein
MNQLPDVYDARSSIVWLRLISSLAWLDSALVGKDAKLSYAFLSGLELAKRIGENERSEREALVSEMKSAVVDYLAPRPTSCKISAVERLQNC